MYGEESKPPGFENPEVTSYNLKIMIEEVLGKDENVEIMKIRQKTNKKEYGEEVKGTQSHTLLVELIVYHHKWQFLK